MDSDILKAILSDGFSSGDTGVKIAGMTKDGRVTRVFNGGITEFNNALLAKKGLANVNTDAYAIGVVNGRVTLTNEPYFTGFPISQKFNTDIKEFKIPDGVEVVEASFYNNGTLERFIMSDTVVELNGFCERCWCLKEIKLSKSLTTLACSFRGCGLVTVAIPDLVQAIGDLCFADNDCLQTVRIPASVKYIGDACFEGCTNLTVKVKKGSYAEGYCYRNSMPFEYY